MRKTREDHPRTGGTTRRSQRITGTADDLPGGPRRAEHALVRLADLAPNRLQDEVYDPLDETELNALRDDVCRRGLEHAIEVLPPVERSGKRVYEIVDGHQRARVLALLGNTEAQVLVRHDLANASDRDRAIAFVNANLVRRQLDAVQRVRAAVRRFELETNKGRPLAGSQLEKAREEIGALMGLSGRTVSRYLRLSRTPLPVQRAVSRGLLRLTVGERVADLTAEQQAAVAERINGVDDAAQVRDIVAEYLGDQRDRHLGVANALASFIRGLERGLHDLDGRVQRVSPSHVARHATTLQHAATVIATLLATTRESQG